MEILNGGITLHVPSGAFPLSTDSILLSDFAKLPKNARILDMGSGCGTLGLLLCAKDSGCRVVGVEIDASAHQAALENIQRNHLEARMSSICADLRTIHEELTAGSFDICISNPPYFTGGPVSQTAPLARRDDCCDIQSLCESAGRMLKYGGNFFLVHKPERLAEICACASIFHLEPKRLCLVRHHRDAPVSLILLSCRKGGKAGLVWEERCLFDENAQPTEYYRTLYHL
ncbi:MAG: methyltransferase domain-containing protein [Ruminococcaceae bacterium]|nr:methyltransferase domain-containing protein [Oscillospiraceae bacterium]